MKPSSTDTTTLGKSSIGELVTAVTVNFKTPDLTTEAVESFKSFYDIGYILIDNGGDLVSLAACRKLANKHDLLLVSNHRNIGHGRALNQAISLVDTPYVFTLDSDTRTEKGGFLEGMLELFREHWDLFATGWLRYVNEVSGVAHPSQGAKQGQPYIHPYAALLNVQKFRSCRPFADRGAPAIELMVDATQNKGFTVADYPVDEYIWHKVAGTRGMFLGNCKPKTDEKPREWKRRGI